MKLGMFDPSDAVPYAKTPLSEIDSEPHRVLALKTARESLVLLKNTDHLLPLGMKYEHIAVIGPNADSVDPLLGNYNGTPSHPVTVLDGIRTKFEGVSYVAGSSLTGPSLTPIVKGFLTNKSPMEGLVGAYFKGTQLQGTPAFTRIDPNVNFAWRDGAGRGLTEDFSVRWTGTLVPPTTGDYQIGFTGTDAFHFWLDDQLIGESWYSDTAKTRLKTIHLEAGRSYAVKIECSQEGASGMARLVWHVPGDWDQVELAKVVKRADLIVAVLGLAGELEGEEMPIKIDGFSGGDRTSLNLPAAQEQLLKDLVASGKPVVVVLMNGSALGVNWADQHAPAILEAWYPGEEGGTAVAEALAGDFSPGGKLPLTFYKSVDQLPAFEDYSMKGRTYRYFTGEPLYPFGYGLSYTTFEYRNLSFDKTSLDANDNLTAKVDVKNTGKIAGDEVVEVYVSRPGLDGGPIRALAGFQRVHIGPGATEHVAISVPNRQLSLVEADGTRKIVSGDLQVWVGGGQPGSRDGMATPGVAGSVKITGEVVLPK
jgi:beta-glucosidase